MQVITFNLIGIPKSMEQSRFWINFVSRGCVMYDIASLKEFDGGGDGKWT